MSILELSFVAVALSMDAFAVAICKGLSLKKVRLRDAITVGVYFGFFQAAMPALGYLVGRQFYSQIQEFDHWVTFILLGLIGLNMIREALKKDDDIEKQNGNSKTTSPLAFRSMILLAIATSVDALAVGVSFAFLQTNILSAIALIGLITFAISAVGTKIGSVFGVKYKSKAEIAGGIILILIGTKILLEHLNLLTF